MRTLHMLHSLDVEPGNPGSTVRNGLKWADALGQSIELCVCDKEGNHEVKGHAMVMGIWQGMFFEIPARLIEREHEVRSRTYSGLLASMRNAYGENFREDNFVVVLSYQRGD
jgi:hypothetical protein